MKENGIWLHKLPSPEELKAGGLSGGKSVEKGGDQDKTKLEIPAERQDRGGEKPKEGLSGEKGVSKKSSEVLLEDIRIRSIREGLKKYDELKIEIAKKEFEISKLEKTQDAIKKIKELTNDSNKKSVPSREGGERYPIIDFPDEKTGISEKRAVVKIGDSLHLRKVDGEGRLVTRRGGEIMPGDDLVFSDNPNSAVEIDRKRSEVVALKNVQTRQFGENVRSGEIEKMKILVDRLNVGGGDIDGVLEEINDMVIGKTK
ncbi:MAG TPA: hypothetical protein PLV72_00680 [Candidatus Magasanikbacteria bacterium]|nr:hypothetical protein [Candidatus Magasanikbacteria bacterium]